MFEILFNNKSLFSIKSLEEIAFKIACEIANEILRNMLEEYDKRMMETRDTKMYRHKGKETTTVKAKTGLVEYTRTKYITKDEKGKNKCVYLTDEILNIKEMGQVSGGIIELVVKNISEVSYRVCAEMISNMTGLTISGAGVWNIVQKLGKDRKEQIEKYKKQHPKEEVPKKVRNIELKLGMTYEGWKEIGKNKYELVGKEYVSCPFLHYTCKNTKKVIQFM